MSLITRALWPRSIPQPSLPAYVALRSNDAMKTHYQTYPAAHPHGLATRPPDARWPYDLLDLYRTAYWLHGAAQHLWRLAQAQGWRDESLTRAYRAAFDALDQVELLAAPRMRAWEVSHPQ